MPAPLLSAVRHGIQKSGFTFRQKGVRRLQLIRRLLLQLISAKTTLFWIMHITSVNVLFMTKCYIVQRMYLKRWDCCLYNQLFLGDLIFFLKKRSVWKTKTTAEQGLFNGNTLVNDCASRHQAPKFPNHSHLEVIR